MTRSGKRLIVGLIAWFMIVLLGAWSIKTFFVLNVTPSIPLGFYVASRVPTALERGMIVVFPAPTTHEAYRRDSLASLPLAKPLVGLPGDSVCVVGGRFIVHNVDYGLVHPDVPHAEGCYVVPQAHVVTGSPVLWSFDSRYFGPISLTSLTDRLRPVLTWGDTHASAGH